MIAGRYRKFGAKSAAAAVVVVTLTLCSLPTAATESRGRDTRILTFGQGIDTMYAVDHGDLVSIYAERLQIETVIDNLQDIGGPTIISREPIDRKVTVTLHKVPMEEVLRRIFDGYSFTYHYKGERIASVRILGIIEGREFTESSALETRAEWAEVELGSARASDE